MAHSNRAKLREARGGLTRNQLRKSKNANNSVSQSSRLQDTIRFIEANEERRRMKPTKASKEQKEVKVVIYAKGRRFVARRRGALDRLEKQLGLGMKNKKKNGWGANPMGSLISLTDGDKVRIKKEIHTLKARI